jgi:hypothetical protein
MIGENQRECGLRTEDHDSKVWRRETINFFDFSRRTYRNSTCKSLSFSSVQIFR